MEPKALDLQTLSQAVAGSAAAFRANVKLTPAGGPGDKVFPPTYMKEGRAETKYAFEQRRVGDREITTVLLDSVASQANRMEEALLEGCRSGELKIPVVQIDFTGDAETADLDKITTLQAPHRIADALLRDSTLKGEPFRRSGPGRAFTDARVDNATAVYRFCPTALIFGVWDSTGPKGGLGAKFQRCLVSEIVGLDAVPGKRVGSRIDPAAIQKASGPIYQSREDPTDWTPFPADARALEKAEGKKSKATRSTATAKSEDGSAPPEALVPFSRKSAEGKDKGTPAAINHGNVPPSIEPDSGGVTISHAVQTVVLSLPALRRLRFQEDCAGERLPGERRMAAERAARTTLAALALAAVVYQREQGYDLRSRSILVPEAPLTFELLGSQGGPPACFHLDRSAAARLLNDALEAASELGMGWELNPITLEPMPKLVHLIKKSRELSARGETDEGE